MQGSGLLYRVVEPFVMYGKGGSRENFTVGKQVYAANHPAVIKCPQSFEAIEPLEGAVETATAEPGEKRETKRGRGKTTADAGAPVETATAEPGEKRGTGDAAS